MNRYISLVALLVIATVCTVHAQFTVVPQTGHNDVVVAMEYSPDGKFLATTGRDFKVLLWETKSMLHYPLAAHTTVVGEVRFSPDSKTLASVDGTNIYVWDVATRKVLTKYKSNTIEVINRVKFVSNDELALQEDKMFKVWNFRTNTFPEKIPLSATHFTFNNITKEILLLEYKTSLSIGSGFTETYKMVLYDRAKRAPANDQWMRPFGTKWRGGEFSESGKYLVLIGKEEIMMLDYKSKKKLWSVSINMTPRKIVITPDDSRVIFAGDLEHPTLLVLDLATGKTLQEQAEFSDFDFGYNDQLQIVAGSHDLGNYSSYAIRIYDLKAKALIRTMMPNEFSVTKIAWNPEAKHLYGFAKEKAFVWDLSKGMIVESSIEDFDKEIFSFKRGTVKNGMKMYSPSKALYAEINENWEGVKIFSAKDGQQVFSTDKIVGRVAFSNDEKIVYCIGPDDLHAFDLTSKALLRSLNYEIGSLSYVALSPDGKFLALGKYAAEATLKAPVADFKIDILDPATFKVIRQLEGHTSNVISLDFTPDNKYLISGSLDGSIRFWDCREGKQKAILYGDSPDNYFVQMDNGYYSASKSAIDKVAFDYLGTMVPGKLFEIQMNRPDKVAETFGYSNPEIIAALKKAFEKRIAQLGIAEQQLKFEELPKLTVTNLPAPSVSSKKIQLNYEALDNINELNNIKVLINNVPIYGRKGLNIKTKKSVKGKLDIELTEGLNKVEISVVNGKGSSSLPVTFDVFCSANAKPDLYLITIGVDKFLDQDYNLNYAAKDAKDIAALFESKKSFYGKFTHLPFYGIQATKENILSVKSTLEKSKPDDQVIIFVASHGLLDEKYDYYLATYNMMFDKPAFQGLAYNDLEGMLDGIPARKKLIIMDACHSGEVDASEVTASTEVTKNHPGVKARGFKPVKKVSNIGIENSFDLMKNMFADLREGTGTTVISSAGGVEFAVESDEWSNGAFTAALLEGIKTKAADVNRDANITVGELKNYVFKRVVELTDGKQHPTSRVDNIDNNFTILSTIATSTGGKTFDMMGRWEASEEEDYVTKKFVPIDPKSKDPVTVTKSVDGFYYMSFGRDGLKLEPDEPNTYNGPGYKIIMESDKAFIKKDTYDTIRYRKIQ